MTELKPKYRGTKEYLLVYAELINAARCRGTVTYQEVAEIMGLPLSGSHMGAETGYMLGEISAEEVSHGRPMLSAIAVNTRGVPGPGFIPWAERLGRYKGSSKESEKKFWKEEEEAIYETWRKKLKSK